jgi:hypothetical protein
VLAIMVNHERYGGGGIYNAFSTFTTGHKYSAYVFVHELGHSFFGLGDEYYASTVTFNSREGHQKEPLAPNLTALHDPENIKWQSLVTDELPIPTPWDKKQYDSLNYFGPKALRQKEQELKALMRADTTTQARAHALFAYNRMILQKDSLIRVILEDPALSGKVGAFEGAGYVSEGLYRPSLDCIMFSKIDTFCPVCSHVIIDVIAYYSK